MLFHFVSFHFRQVFAHEIPVRGWIFHFFYFFLYEARFISQTHFMRELEKRKSWTRTM